MQNTAKAVQVPLVSSRVKSDVLRIPHLPRMLLILELAKAGLLPKGYNAGDTEGFSGMLNRHFGLRPGAFIHFVNEKHPTNREAEIWFRKNAAAKTLTKRSIKRFERDVLNYNLSAEDAAIVRAYVGIPNGGASKLRNASRLIDLEDRERNRRVLLGYTGEALECPLAKLPPLSQAPMETDNAAPSTQEEKIVAMPADETKADPKEGDSEAIRAAAVAS